ncbi:Asp23/Gls24 family envelope stress response protein [Arthrobacter sp. NEB 688]|uniref:Asp23/Gls24 family envelope stress response protein n=1 Tax=Arthrobacter sp. NEB 688 TaxID=904039 RepID=UPI001564BBE8|nr:Asp23/Gls24 family envelope stress response protein [Arthrobacter sp. NEB 688]QKE85547.1 Asp23/Gls24 family envelope stress response protein [Arthrobacter sp. NEB 688]
MAVLGTTAGTVETAPSTRGRTRIADSVVGTIAALAARDVPGVAHVGTGAERLAGAVVHRLTGSATSTAGVTVVVDERVASLEVELVVTASRPVLATAADVRLHVVEAVEGMTGLAVARVDVTVADLADDTAVADPRTTSTTPTSTTPEGTAR